MHAAQKFLESFRVLAVLLAFDSVGSASPCQNPGEWVWPPFNHGVDPTNPSWDPDQGNSSAHSQAGKSGSNCKYNAIHAALIPTGPNQGDVIVFGRQYQRGTPWIQFWSIISVGPDGADPSQSTTFHNYSMQLPNLNILFCSGHAWTANGRLFVAGGEGTTLGGGSPAVYGSDDCFIWNPNTNVFKHLPLMGRKRYYPTVRLSSDDTLMVFSGTEDSDGNCYTSSTIFDAAVDSYEVWDPSLSSPAGAWQVDALGSTVFAGPNGGIPTPAPPPPAPGQNDYFRYYPRVFPLTDGKFFMAGMHNVPARLQHQKVSTGGGGYTINSHWEVFIGHPMAGRRLYGSSFLFPGLEDVVVSTVGADGEEACRVSDPYPIGNLSYLSSVEYAVGSASTISWSAAQNVPDETVGTITYPGARATASAVVLPDESILLVGGSILDSSGATVFYRDTRRFVGQPGSGGWAFMDSEDSDRGYHATALLLPDGRVLSAGGEGRDFDYQIFRPPYLVSGLTRPVLGSGPSTMQYFEANPIQYAITYNALPSGVVVDKIVLVAPGSDTHHSDMSQQLVELQIISTDQGGTRTRFYAPHNSKHAPRGYYMLFAVTNQGTPSVAQWVQLL